MFDFSSVFNRNKIENIKQNILNNVPQKIVGLPAEGKGVLFGLFGKNGIFVISDLVSGSRIAEELSSFGYNIKFLTGTYENNFALEDKNLKADFFSILNNFALGKIDMLFVTTDVLFQKCPDKKKLLMQNIILKKNQIISREQLLKNLIQNGYENVDYLSARGQFTFKGDVLTLFPFDEENLIRVEFFDTQIEKISTINFDDRKYLFEIEFVNLIAVNCEKTNNNVLSYAEKVFFDEPKQLMELAKNFSQSENFLPLEQIFNSTTKSQTEFCSIDAKTFFKAKDIVFFQRLATKKYVIDFKELKVDIEFYLNSGKKIYLFCKDEIKHKILDTFLEENLYKNNPVYKSSENLLIVDLYLPYSLAFVDSDVIFIGTNELFKKEKQKPKNKNKVFYAPKVGEYVVHIVHGVGRCIAVSKLKIGDCTKDYFVIEYANGDKFYLPTEQADDISAYGSETAPKLNKLGGVEFSKVKEKVYKNVKELAFDLLKLYAKREQTKGNIYIKDDYLMQVFEDAFPYEETADQLQAIMDIKADMEGEKIMDRLICGDVGYGKTEVALRAIYKAVLSGKQVAFLCPTTILSEQHYQTCLKRFTGFMVNTARFNRLISSKEQTEVLKNLENGNINVVCGTHKLLSKNVKFNNLGLLVLDEEQRFGVEDKEKIKNLKTNVDVLALSATPIPRTLHMSLSGIRDISIIDTPPKQRLPIQTFVTEYSDELITRACNQELSRGGQVLIIFNRIENIYHFTEHLKSLLPNVSIGVAHGRLSPKELEASIMKLYSKQYQILVSTTLIENGIDIPSANTLFVIDADKLGLSQLYQIRGRIGRSNQKAFAYLTVDGGKNLSSTAYQRLTAIMENTALGSGFKIAMADMEIRGAGNVLGKEQHGNMIKVGYELYYKLLESALKELKGESTESKKAIRLDITLDAYISEQYIQAEEDRIRVYGQISVLSNILDMKNYLLKIGEEYGKIPKEFENLCLIAVLKNIAQNCGVRRILINQNTCTIYFYEKQEITLQSYKVIKQKVLEAIEYLKA